MTYLLFKALISGVIVAVVSEIARRSPAVGALVASLPLVSLLAMIWLWRDTHDVARIAAYSQATFWFVIPSLPMFLILPVLLRHGMGVWPALGIGCAITFGLYALMVFVLARIGVDLP